MTSDVTEQLQEEAAAADDKQSNPRGPIIFGLTLIFVAFGGFVLWAANAPLDSAVAARGVIVVESERKVVQHLEGGIVENILVRDGDYVEKGELLLLLDDTRPKAILEITKGQLNVALALVSRLKAERDQEETITFRDELLLNSEDKNVSEIIEGQNQLFEARKNSMRGEIDILNQRIAQFREEISGMKAQQASREEQIALFDEEIVGLEKLSAASNIAENFVLDKKRQLAQLQGEKGKFKADVARANQGIGEAQLNIGQLKKNLQEEVVMQFRDVQATIADLEERLVAAQDTIDRTRITAPSSGVVIGLNVHTQGGVIGGGANILEIVPQGEELIFEARVQITDIDDIKLGQRATVRLSAFSFRHTMLIDGIVIHASADSLTDPLTGESYFSVRIRVPIEELAKLGDAILLPGMPVESLIKTGKSTMLGYMMAPIRDSMARAFIER